MNSSHHSVVRPVSLGPLVQLPHAELGGLQVDEVSFAEWLAAGGERRRLSRREPSDAELGFAPGRRVLRGLDAIAAHLERLN